MEELGINPVLLIAQIISFGTLLFLLNKFLYKKIRVSLAQRREAVRKSVELELETQKRLKTIEENDAKREKKNQAELQSLRAEAKKNAESLKKQILAEAEQKGEKIVETARKRIEQEKEAAADDLRREAKKLAAEMTQKVLLEKSGNAKWQEEQLEKSLEQLKTIN